MLKDGFFALQTPADLLKKLRHDYQEQLDGRFSLRTFHDAVLAQGTAPLWAHRRLLLNDATDATLE